MSVLDIFFLWRTLLNERESNWTKQKQQQNTQKNKDWHIIKIVLSTMLMTNKQL